MKANTAKIAVLVGALGYLVDVYDLMLFTILRIPSFQSLHIPPSEQLSAGVLILNLQMIGMALGGFIWGMLGDKRGRISPLVGSILLYSVACFANAFVQSIATYAALRFIAGIGLAGELGSAVTLVCESLPTERRGFGTMYIAAAGALGGIIAAAVGFVFPWRFAYMLGGILGVGILVLRMRLSESHLFLALPQNPKIKRGDLSILFGRWKTASKYLTCLAIGVPFTYFFGILVTFSPELSSQRGYAVSPALAMVFANFGVSFGDLSSSVISQFLRSRKRAIAIYLAPVPLLGFILLQVPGFSVTLFYALIFALGICVGYWAVWLTLAAEQFGTNLRATVATSLPNCVRGVLVLLTLALRFTTAHFAWSLSQAALYLGVACSVTAFFSVLWLRESFSLSLDYVEV